MALWRRARGEPILFPPTPVQRHTLVVVDGPECAIRGAAVPIAAAHLPGDVYLYAPGNRFDPRSLRTSTYWILSFARYPIAHCLVARPRGLPATLLADRAPVQRFRADPDQLARLTTELALLQTELSAATDRAAVPPLLSLVLTEVARLEAVARPSVTGISDAVARQELLRDVFNVIEARYRTPIGLTDVAKVVGRSPAHLTHAVRAETGRTVLQWIIERRMREAERQLIDTDHPLQVIAHAVGYDSVGHFIRQFTRRNGMPPGLWRGERRNGVLPLPRPVAAVSA
jgi:AraC-like DNA-binding protein